MALPLAEDIAERIAAVIGVDAGTVAPMLVEPPQASMGDYSLPCFRLAPALRKDPKGIAKEIEARLEVSTPITEIRAEGAYLNLRVSAEALARSVVGAIARASDENRAYASSEEGRGKTIVIEYSSPNIAKPFGIGHLRSTVIGNSLVRLYRAAGYTVVRLNYPGDWGTQFGLILTAWRAWGDPARLSAEGGGVSYLVDLYQRANAEAGADPAFAEDARAAFKGLEDGQEEALALWRRFREISLAEFQRVYDLMDVSFDSFDGEAATRPLIDGAIDELQARGLLKESEGAQVVELGLGENVPPAMIRKSDGATTYLARDLAAVLERQSRYSFERCIYVVGRDQELHFRQLFRVLELMGIEWATRCVHVPFGMIRFGGEKMRTRAGSNVLLDDVLERAFGEVGRIVESREKDAGLSEEEQRRIDRSVAMGAVIFADLSRKRIKDFDFDWETAFSLDGDSGPYLQYAHARSSGILRRWGREVRREVDFSCLRTEPERGLLKALGRHPDVVARARQENEPSLVGAHLLEMGRALNSFYNSCRVLGAGPGLEEARLLLVWASRKVLAEALAALGIKAPESM